MFAGLQKLKWKLMHAIKLLIICEKQYNLHSFYKISDFLKDEYDFYSDNVSSLLFHQVTE